MSSVCSSKSSLEFFVPLIDRRNGSLTVGGLGQDVELDMRSASALWNVLTASFGFVTWPWFDVDLPWCGLSRCLTAFLLLDRAVGGGPVNFLAGDA